MKKRVFSLVLALLLCVGLAVPVLAATPEIDICWLDGIDGSIFYSRDTQYNAELNWLALRREDENGDRKHVVIDLSTGNTVEDYTGMRKILMFGLTLVVHAVRSLVSKRTDVAACLEAPIGIWKKMAASLLSP